MELHTHRNVHHNSDRGAWQELSPDNEGDFSSNLCPFGRGKCQRRSGLNPEASVGGSIKYWESKFDSVAWKERNVGREREGNIRGFSDSNWVEGQLRSKKATDRQDPWKKDNLCRQYGGVGRVCRNSDASIGLIDAHINKKQTHRAWNYNIHRRAIWKLLCHLNHQQIIILVPKN